MKISLSVLATTLFERAVGHAHMVEPMSRNEMAYQLAGALPAGMPGDFQYCPHCCVGAFPDGACGSGDTRGTDVWQQWYDASGLAMPTLTPGSDFKVSQLMNADHGGQVWVMVACGNEISENVNWTYLERSDFDRGGENYLPSNPEIYGWYENMSYGSHREWWLHVPASFSCPGGTAVGRWLWKTGNSCNDFNNVGFKTTTFKASEWAAVGKDVQACTGSPETFISCVDFKVLSAAVPTPAPTPPTQAPTTPAPPPPTTAPAPGCSDANQYCEDWAANGECEINPGFMLENCPASCGVCSSPGPCTDDNQYCEDWAASGQCEANPNYMLESCRKSCGVCSLSAAARLEARVSLKTAKKLV